MAPKSKLRISTRYQEIFSVIQSAKKGKENFLWKLVAGKRKTFPIDILRVESERNRIDVQLRDARPAFEVGSEVYLKLDSRDSAFKTAVLERLGGKLTLSFPDELVLNENRESKRHYFHPIDEKVIQIKRVKNLSSSLSEKSHNFLTLDVSESGFCFFIPTHSHFYFDVNTKVSLEILGSHKLEKPLSGEVVFKMPFELKGALGREPGFKVGVQLSSKIPDTSLKRFILKNNIFSITDEQIVRDAAFRKKVQGNLVQLREKLSKRKGFKALFDSLEIAQSDHQYLKQHIHLLSEVMAGLGSRLGWVTDKTIEKMVYVAYLHDIRLVAYPRVARIPTLKEFERVKSSLSEAEKNAFLEAPAYAAELASQDSDVYPDAIKILLQQKELPDGTGFPNALTSMKLIPLSCLFITSHFFVDYVINHADWTVADFIHTYQKKLKGQYFQKIFQAMKG